ncbi:MAG: DUF2892 domain-containing protein [Acidobacteriota bacterium]
MNFVNEGTWDRGGRTVVGILLIAAGWAGLVSGALGVVLIVVGAVALGTGIIGWCPAYTVCGISTRKV